MTATLRHHWGLNSILNLEDDTKTRDDHRHHAVDALVMACSTRSHLQELSKRNRYHKNYDLKDFPDPWLNFRQDAENAVAQILVSHKKQKNLLTVRTHSTKKNGVLHKNIGVAARVQLHLDTIYGKRKDVFTKELSYHIRKPLKLLSAADIPKIVDLEIRKIIYKRIKEIGIGINTKDKKPIVKTKEEKNIFTELLNDSFFLPNNAPKTLIHSALPSGFCSFHSPIKADGIPILLNRFSEPSMVSTPKLRIRSGFNSRTRSTFNCWLLPTSIIFPSTIRFLASGDEI